MGSEYAMVLSIPLSKYKKVPFPENQGNFWRKYKKVFQGSFFYGKILRTEARKCAELFVKKYKKIFLRESSEG